jgi:hypothetical protein
MAPRRRTPVRLLVAVVVWALSACGGGNSSETTLTGPGVTGAANGAEVVLNQPQGSNTTEVVVDTGPALGSTFGSTAVANLPYVTVKVCAPGSSTACATIDHVFLDTGSVGLRLLRSSVATLNLPAMTAAGGTVVECYPFVIGAVWGPLATADISMAGEQASGLPVQIIDDGSPTQAPVTSDCLTAANGGLLNTMGKLQAKGVLGVGMLRYDCGLLCDVGDYTGTYTLYYTCNAAGACVSAAVGVDQQVQNPVAHFPVNNNGTILALPKLADTGASVARGRLVFGIGTQTNNQPPASGTILYVETNPALSNYLYINTRVGSTAYPNSYIDSGSNGYFFDDSSISKTCAGSGTGSNWYCPGSPQSFDAVLSDGLGAQSTISLRIVSADVLFSSANTAFATLGGAAGSANPGAFVHGLPFFYGRNVYTAIWGQSLALNGPWYAWQAN